MSTFRSLFGFLNPRRWAKGPAQASAPQEAEADGWPLMTPKKEDVFYHYCSVDTFRTICQTKTLRFSDINMMNDFTENNYGYSIFEQAATRLLNMDKTERFKLFAGMDKAFFDAVDENISPMQLYVHPVMCAFSRKPDVLSQWRAYANNASGVAIGFGGEAFLKMPVSLLDVDYDHERQVRRMMALLMAVYAVEEKSGHTRGADFRNGCQEIGAYLPSFKNPGFVEEDEVRCLHLLVVKRDKVLRLIDEDGFEGAPGQEVKFRTANDGLIAYVDLPFLVDEENQPIKQVWLGPRNDNGPGNILYMLGAYGYRDVELHPSRTSYR